MRYPPLISLYSPVMQSGKTQVANYLRERYGYTVVKFADGLKAMLRAFYGELGHTPQFIDALLEGDLKDRESGNLRSPRHLMQTLGTDWGRNLVHPDIWCDATRKKCARLIAEGKRVVVEDTRLPNEYWMCRRAVSGGLVVQIIREGAPKPNRHECEGALNNYAFDVTLGNNGTLNELYASVDRMLG